MDILDDKYNPTDKYSFRARNFQSYEMGLDEKLEDEVEVRKQLIELLNMFHGIIITERFLESLILLAAVLHIPVWVFFSVSWSKIIVYRNFSLRIVLCF